MSLEIPSATDSNQQINCPPAQPRYRHLQQNPLTFPSQNPGVAAYQDAIHDPPAQHDEAEADIRNLRAKQCAPPAARPIQNRAAFGKWKSKAVPGFPAANMPLPPGITATQIAESYPNHVSDHVILALMRQGKGAKAIDALIPAPPGKTKAGQSHSKIQLRISTIREAFPDENFPITSTKRNTARGKVQKDEPMSLSDEHANPTAAGRTPNSSFATARNSDTKFLHPVATQLQDNVGFSNGTQNDGSMRFISPEDLSHRGQLPPHLDASGLGSPYTQELSRPSWSPRHTRSLDVQIKEEYQKHQHLLFIHLYANKPLPPLELAQTVQSQCAAAYDAISHQLQAQSGVTLTKAILPSGWPEHSLSYLQRSIMECFKGHPAFRTHGQIDTIEGQTGRHSETAVFQELLGHLRDWTRFLETKLDNNWQTESHSNVNSNATSSVNPGSLRPGLHSASYQTRGGRSASGLDSDASLVTFRGPIFESPRSETCNNDTASDDRARYLRAATQPQPESLREIQTYLEQADRDAGNFEGSAQPTRSDSISGLKEPFEETFEEHTVTDAPEMIPNASRYEFEDYMEEVEESVNRQARAVDMLPAFGKQYAKFLFLLKPLSIFQLLCRSSHRSGVDIPCRSSKLCLQQQTKVGANTCTI
jgi:hypothetical protein